MLITGPLIALAVVAVLALVLRWAFNADVRKIDTALIAAARDDDFGLLSVAGTVDSIEEADALRERLASAGIRATTAPAPEGRFRILVFAIELPTARRVVGR